MARIEADWQKLDHILQGIFQTLQKTDKALEDVKNEIRNAKVNTTAFGKLKEALSFDKETRAFNRSFNTIVKGLRQLDKIDFKEVVQSFSGLITSFETLNKVDFTQLHGQMKDFQGAVQSVSIVFKDAKIGTEGKKFATGFNQITNALERLETTDLESVIQKKFVGPLSLLRRAINAGISNPQAERGFAVNITDFFKSVEQISVDLQRVQLPAADRLNEVGKFARALEQITLAFARLEKNSGNIKKAKRAINNISSVFINISKSIAKKGILIEFSVFTDGLDKVLTSLDKVSRSAGSLSLPGILKMRLALSTYGNTIKRLSKDVGPDQGQAIQRLGSGARGLGEGIEAISRATKNFGTLSIGQLLSTFANLLIINNRLSALFRSLAKTGKKFDTTALKNFTEFVRSLGIIIKSLADLSSQGQGFRGAQLAASIQVNLTPISNLLKDLTKRNFKRVGKDQLLAISEVVKGLGTLIGGLTGEVKTGSVLAFKEVVGILLETLEKLNRVKIDKKTVSALDSFVKAYEKLTKVGAQDINTGGFKDFAEAIRSFAGLDKLDEKSFKTLAKFADGLASAVERLRKVKFDKNQAEGLRAFADALQVVSKDLSGDTKFSFAPNIDNEAATKNGFESGSNMAEAVKKGVFSAQLEIFFAQVLGKALLTPFKTLGNLTFGGIDLLFRGIRSGVGFAVTGVRELVQGFGRVRDAVREAGRNIREVGQDIRDAGQTLLETFDIRKLFNSSAFTAAADFDQRLTQIKVFGNATTEELAKYEELAFKIGRDYPLSALDGLNAAFSLVKAGLSSTDIESALPSIADLTSLSESQNIEEISKIIIATTNTFDRFEEGVVGNFENVATAANIFSAASSLTNTTVESLGQGLVVVGATANSLGQDLDGTVAALALLQDSGLEAAQSGTALRGVLNDLSRDKSVETLQALGISLFQDDGSRRSLDDVVSDLYVSLENLNQEQRETILNDLVGAEARGALNILLSEGVDGIDNLVDAMKEVPPAQQRAAETLDNFKGDLVQLQGSLETLYIKGFLPLLAKAFRPFVQLGRKVVDGLLNLDAATLEFLTTGIALVSIVGSIAGVLTIVLGSLLSIGGGFLSLLPILLSAQTIFLGIGAGIAGVAAGLLVVLPLIAAFGALFVGLASIENIFRNNLGGASDALRFLGATVRGILSPLGAFVNLFIAMFRAIGSNAEFSILEQIGAGIANFADRITRAIYPLSRASIALSTFINDGLNNAFNADSVKTIFGSSFFSSLFEDEDLNTTRDKIVFLEGLFEEFFYDTLAPAKLGLKFISNAFGQFFQDIGAGLSVSESFAKFADVTNKSMGLIVSSLLDGFTFLTGIDTSGLQEAFRGNFVEGLNTLLATAREAALNFLVTNREQIGEILRSIFRTFFVPGRSIGAIANLLGLNEIASVFNQIADFFTDLFSAVFNTVINLIEGQSLGDAIQNGFRSVFGNALDPLFDLLGSLATTGQLIIQGMSEIIRAIFFPNDDEIGLGSGEGIAGIIGGLANGLNSAITFLNTNVLGPLVSLISTVDLSGIRAFLGELFGILGQIVTSLGQGDFEGAIAGLGDVLQLLITTISDFFNALGITPASVLTAIASFAQGILNAFVDNVGSLSTSLLSKLDEALTVDLGSLTSTLTTAFSNLSSDIASGDPAAIAGGVAEAILSLLGAALGGGFGTLGEIFDFDAQPIVDQIASSLSTSIAILDGGDIFGGVAAGVTSLLLSAISGAFTAIASVFNLDLSPFIDTLAQVIDKNFALIKEGPGGVFAAIGNTIVTAIAGTINLAFAGLAELLDVDPTFALERINTDLTNAMNTITELFTGEEGALDNIINTVSNLVTAITNLFDGLGGAAGSGAGEGVDILQFLFDALATIVTFPVRVITLIAESLNKLTGGLERLSETNPLVLTVVLGALGAFLAKSVAFGTLPYVPQLISMFNAVKGFVAPVASFITIGAFLANLVDNLADLETFDIAGVVTAILESFADLGVQLIEILGLDTVFEDFLLQGDETFAEFKERIGENFAQLAQIIRLSFNSLGSQIGQIFDAIVLDLQKTILNVEADLGSGIIGDILNIPDRGISELRKIFDSEDPFDLSRLIAFVGENDIDPTAVNTYVRDSLGKVVNGYRQVLASGDYQLSAADFVLLSEGNVFGDVLGELLNANDFNFAQELISNLTEFNPEDIQLEAADFDRILGAIDDAFQSGLIEGEQAQILLTDLLQFEEFDTERVNALIRSTIPPEVIAEQAAQAVVDAKTRAIERTEALLEGGDSQAALLLTSLFGSREQFEAEAATLLDGTRIPLENLQFEAGETTRGELYEQIQNLVQESTLTEDPDAAPITVSSDLEVEVTNQQEVADNIREGVEESVKNAEDSTPIQVASDIEFDTLQDAESTNEFIESLIRLRQQIAPTQLSLGLLVLSSALVGSKLEELSTLALTFQETFGTVLTTSQENFTAFSLGVTTDLASLSTGTQVSLGAMDKSFTLFGTTLLKNQEIWAVSLAALGLLITQFTEKSTLEFNLLQKSILLVNEEFSILDLSLKENLIPDFTALNFSVGAFALILRTQFLRALELIGDKFVLLNSVYIEDFLKLIQTSSQVVPKLVNGVNSLAGAFDKNLSSIRTLRSEFKGLLSDISSFNSIGDLAGGIGVEGAPVQANLPVAGARASGGPVLPGLLYEVNDTDRPELLVTRDKSYLLSPDAGTVQTVAQAQTNSGVSSLARAIASGKQAQASGKTYDDILGSLLENTSIGEFSKNVNERGGESVIITQGDIVLSIDSSKIGEDEVEYLVNRIRQVQQVENDRVVTVLRKSGRN